jgi:hypothetical protein
LDRKTKEIKLPPTLGFMQVGHDKQTSANCKSKLWFGPDKQLSTLVLNFNFIFSISSGCGRTNNNSQPALLVVRNKMRLLLISILSCLTIYNVKCQTKTTPKTYRYFSEKENWTLRVFEYKAFELLVGIPDESFRYVIEGSCIITDSTIQFHTNPSKSLELIKNDTAVFKLNVKEFINGSVFKKIDDYLIPKLIREKENDKINKSYFQQVELNMGGTKIELRKKNMYTLTITGCKNKWIEKGTYILGDKFIVLTPNNKSNNFSALIMDGNKAIFTKDFLVTKKIEISSQPENFLKEENFIYYLRM